MNNLPLVQKDGISWLSAYLFCKCPLDEVLRELISPVIKDAFGNYFIQYFFIRYYENGPHIRLRLKGETAILEKVIRPKLIQASDDYFSTVLNGNQCSLQFVPYEPEFERYGGPTGTRIAEKIFQASSRIVLNILSAKGWNLKKAIGAAIQLNIIQLFFFFEDREEMKRFLDFEHRNWLQFSIGGIKENESEIGDLITEQAMSYEKQSNAILYVLRNVWARLHDRLLFGDENTDQWKKDVEEIYAEFKANQNEITSTSTLTSIGHFISSDYDLKKWLIVDSYLHMTNNRLGLLYKDESYTYYILKNFSVGL